MKIEFDYCTQTRRYGDSVGKCLVRIEDDETYVEVVEKMQKNNDLWYAEHYLNPRLLYFYENSGNQFVGNLILFETCRAYLD